MTTASERTPRGLSLRPMRALRPTVDAERLGRLLCPPYDVIGVEERRELLAREPDNAVGVVLPEEADGRDRYQIADRLLSRWVADGLYAVDDVPALYVYEMCGVDGATTRGLLGAVELRDPEDGVILPHENTMAGPVADRLDLMRATRANVEPIYLVYDGGGPASEVVRDVDAAAPLAQARTPDGITHRLWGVVDTATQRAVGKDLASRRALIADGHHRYATYRRLQQELRAQSGPGPWDYGLTLLVDSSSYGPQVHAIHRVLVGMDLDSALAGVDGWVDVVDVSDPGAGLSAAAEKPGFAAVLADASRAVLITDRGERLRAAAARPDEPAALAELDVTVLHRALVEEAWQLPDTVDMVGYAHTIADALADAQRLGGTAILLRPTPVDAVAGVAAAGARMPRKSTLFTPKPASGLVMRRFVDEH